MTPPVTETVGAELKFHGNAGHAHKKVHCENSGPETLGLIVVFVFSAQGNRLERHDKEC
jgi:hypothetical protein